METMEVMAMVYLLIFLGVGAAFIHYQSFARSKASSLVKDNILENKTKNTHN